MRRLNQVYTQAYNRRHGRVGHVLQGRFKSILVDKNQYLLELSRYVVLNPVRAGMTTSVNAWAWSSYRATAGFVPPPAQKRGHCLTLHSVLCHHCCHGKTITVGISRCAKTLPDGFVENFAYDANGNLLETKNAHGDVKREFDPEARLLKEAQGAFTIENTYDANGNRVARATSLGNVVAYEFDALDQAVTIGINQDEPIRIERDAAGRIAHEKLSPYLSRRFRYSVDGYLTEQAVLANESPLFATRFEYDPAGNLTQRSDSQYGTDVYRYDPLGRITEHLDPQSRITRYVNDPAGDRLRTRIVEGTRRRAVGEGVWEGEWSWEGEYQGTYYRFNRAGNLVERRDGERDLHLVWDVNQRLIESHANGTVTRYGYDPLGRRLFKETGDKRTLFYWVGDALVGESVVALNQPKEPMPAVEGNILAIPERREKAPAATQHNVREYVYYPETFEPWP